MKKLFFALTITLMSVLLFSCSSDTANETINSSEESATNLIKQRESVQDVTFGESIEVTNENEVYVLTEYSTNKTMGNKNYIVTMGDNKAPIYLIKYSNNQMQVDDLINGSVEIINTKENVADVDLISMVNDSKVNPDNSRKFWGWQCGLCNQLNFKICCYWILGIQTNICKQEPCVYHPGQQ